MRKQAGYTMVELLVVICGIGGIALAGFLLYVLGHFLLKYYRYFW